MCMQALAVPVLALVEVNFVVVCMRACVCVVDSI
jgi:hypothetical protein